MNNESETIDWKKDVKDLLLENYRYLSDSFWKSEQTGEK
jgi:hypothetical protein